MTAREGSGALLEDAPPTTICLVRLSAIGDVVHTLPLAAALKRRWPESRLTWVAQPLPGKVLEGSPVVDEILPFQRRRGLRSLPEYRTFRRRVADRRFDLIIVPQVAFKAGLLARLIPGPVRLGFDRRRATDLQWAFTTHRVPAGPRGHIVDESLEFARFLGADPGPVEWPVRLSAAERGARDQFFADIDAPVCGVLVGASDQRKSWPPERWAPVVDALEERWGFRVALLGGPSRFEREVADRILERARTQPLDLLTDDLRRMMWLLDGCRLVVGPDTGPLHLAVAFGTPVVGLYGWTNPNLTGPFGPSRSHVVDGFARTPDEAYGTVREYRRDGMERVTPRAVLAGIRKAVKELDLTRTQKKLQDQ